jgi:hypothetical protein
VEVTDTPWIPFTVCERAVPLKSPAAMKQPTQVPVIERFPGNVVVMPDLPIVIPVAEEVPMEIVPVASMMLFESPVMLVPLNVSAAKAIETLARRRMTAAEMMLPTENFFMLLVIYFYYPNQLLDHGISV